ncbi:MAG TPA: universal stress protein [Phnomibacter sp.]|nr:universal stress protein [Phnomibacter sp.]
MNKIVAPVDFSTVSLNAAFFAVHVAEALKRDLLLLHVVQQNMYYGDVTMPVGEYEALSEEAAEALSKLADKLEKETEGRVTVHTYITIGNPVDVLLQTSRSTCAYSIVMGTNGTGSVERFFLGSTTQTLVSEAGCPVIVVPKNYQYSGISNIGFACDFNNVQAKTPDATIKSLLHDFNARLEVLHVNGNHQELAPEMQEAEQLLKTMFSEQQPKFHYLHGKQVEECVLDYAIENKMDMLIVLPENHTLFETFFKHDHTGHFIRMSSIPVLVLKNH